MTITKRTVIDQIEITRSGAIQIRMHKQIVDTAMPADQQVMQSGNHRTLIVPDGQVDAQFAAVNEHLEQMGYPPVPADDIERVRVHARAAWTPEVIEAWTASQLAAITATTQQIEAANAQRLQALAAAESIEQLREIYEARLRELLEANRAVLQANATLQQQLQAAGITAPGATPPAP